MHEELSGRYPTPAAPLDPCAYARPPAAERRELRERFAQQGFVNLGKVLADEEISYFRRLFLSDRERYGYFWQKYGHHQHANYDALLTTPAFDKLIRHPRLYPIIEDLMGGPLCFGEIGLRYMGPYSGSAHQDWHRDRPHWREHPLRMDYLQMFVCLSGVGGGTHSFSISPESVGQPVLKGAEEQLRRGGSYDLTGEAGTVLLYNAAVLHTATTRPTTSDRHTVQIYYGHRHRAPLADDSGIPAAFWRDSPDEETRAFYGVLNERTRVYARNFGPPPPSRL